jgi:hypothetical protein
MWQFERAHGEAEDRSLQLPCSRTVLFSLADSFFVCLGPAGGDLSGATLASGNDQNFQSPLSHRGLSLRSATASCPAGASETARRPISARLAPEPRLVVSLKNENLLQNFYLEAGLWCPILRLDTQARRDKAAELHWDWESPTCQLPPTSQRLPETLKCAPRLRISWLNCRIQAVKRRPLDCFHPAAILHLDRPGHAGVGASLHGP